MDSFVSQKSSQSIIEKLAFCVSNKPEDELQNNYVNDKYQLNTAQYKTFSRIKSGQKVSQGYGLKKYTTRKGDAKKQTHYIDINEVIQKKQEINLNDKKVVVQNKKQDFYNKSMYCKQKVDVFIINDKSKLLGKQKQSGSQVSKIITERKYKHRQNSVITGPVIQGDGYIAIIKNYDSKL